MNLIVSLGILIPFFGTTLGALCVFFTKRELGKGSRQSICGFAAGVMIAAAIWSLLIPAMEYESSLNMGCFSFIPATCGLWIGVLFLMCIDLFIPEQSNPRSALSGENKMLLLSVTLHNLPEGMAVGVVYAALISSPSPLALSGALALSLGIAVQNFPEGAIISLPLAQAGFKRSKAFIYGVGSGIIEPVGALLTLIAIPLILPLLPYLLGFAAGAMIYAVIQELAPIITKGEDSYCGIISFACGFSFMMILDVVLG